MQFWYDLDEKKKHLQLQQKSPNLKNTEKRHRGLSSDNTYDNNVVLSDFIC